MKLNPNLVSNLESNLNFESSLNGTNARGSYNTMRFTIKLRDDILFSMLQGENSHERIQAFSTYLHENIHWWQHVGSNFGFMYSLSYPALSLISIPEIKKLIKKNIIFKPLIKYEKQYFEKHNKGDIMELNKIVYSYYDIEYAKYFALDNKNFSKIIKDNRFFLSIGQCYHILWQSSIVSLTSIDRNYKFLPNVNEWSEKFQNLQDKKVEGFGIDINLKISHLGIKAIYEGQAIFNQLQYLAISLNGELTFKDCENAGMLYGIYYEAFNLFIENTALKKPDSFLSPEVALFLLVCDVAINPTNGFPFNIYDYENFIVKNDPGIRFTKMCFSIRKNRDQYINSINNYSKDEYINISNKLSDSLDSISPNESGKLIQSWMSEQEITELLKEEANNKFLNINQPIRLFFSKFLRFQKDKYENPNIFCWIGYHMASQNKNIDFADLTKIFSKHRALFQETPDNEIKPIVFEHINEATVEETFNLFYRDNVLYDLILKWIYEEGEYKFDYIGLKNISEDDYRKPFGKFFENIFGILIDDIELL